VAARQYLLISDAVSPLVPGEGPTSVIGLARSLAVAGSSAVVLSLAPPEGVAALPGLARRLRTVSVRVGDSTREVAFYEGKAPQGHANLVVAGASGRTRGESALLLAEALRALSQDGLLKADVAIGWGETAAPALSASNASVRVFVVPSGRMGGEMSEADIRLLGDAGLLAGSISQSRLLASFGAAAANAVVAPSPSSARSLERDPGLVERAADEPVIAIRFGCDEVPHDPAHDAALPVNFSGASPAGKFECRRALIRRRSLAVGPKTLLLATAPLRKDKGGGAILDGLAALGMLDAAILIPGQGDVELMDRARRMAIENPGRWAFIDPSEPEDRLMRAAADAVLFGDADDRLGRAVGLAQLYGALPIAFDGGAPQDFLVDYDPVSATGSAVLYGSQVPYEIAGAVSRAAHLRNTTDDPMSFAQDLMRAAPRWARTATAFEDVCASLA
jgi:hypothetical protein